MLLAAVQETELLSSLETALTPNLSTAGPSLRVAQSRPTTLRCLLLTLLFLQAVGLRRTWDLRGYTGQALALLIGRHRAYGYRHTERFLAELADATGDRSYLQQSGGMVTFMQRAQKPNGEFPYMVEGTTLGARYREHFQCYQYNAFECLDLMQYYELTHDSAMRPLIGNCLGFLAGGVARDGHVFLDCGKGSGHTFYHTAVLGAAFAMAGCLGFAGYESLCDQTFAYLLAQQRKDGSFAYSSADYHILQDQRSYPRNLSMILFHFLVNVQAASPQPNGVGVRNAS